MLIATIFLFGCARGGVNANYPAYNNPAPSQGYIGGGCGVASPDNINPEEINPNNIL